MLAIAESKNQAVSKLESLIERGRSRAASNQHLVWTFCHRHFLKLPSGLYFLEVSGVALNSKGHIFVFQRGMHPLVEFDKSGRFEAVTIPERANGRTVVGFAGLDE